MEQTINVQKIEAKITQAGMPMWTIITDKGKLSVFNKETADALTIGQSYVVDIAITDKGYKNLMKIIGKSTFIPASSMQPQMQPQIQHQSREEQIKQKRFDSASFAVSYAIRLAEAGKIEVKDVNAKSKELLALYEEMLDSNLVPVSKVA